MYIKEKDKTRKKETWILIEVLILLRLLSRFM